MRKKRLRRFLSILLLTLCALLLSGCLGSSNKPNLSALQALALPQSAQLLGLTPVAAETRRIDEEAYVEMSCLTIPEDLTPLGQIDAQSGYLFDAKRKNLLLYRYDTGTRATVVSLDQLELERTFGPEIAFSQRWLVWVEFGALREQVDGGLSRDCWLLVRDLSVADAPILQLDAGSVTAAEGIFLPFDSLSIDQSYLVYRRSIFHGGWRDTEVRFIDLEAGTSQTLQMASGSGGRMVLTCNIASGLIAWDVQYAREAQLPGLPPQQMVSYDLYCYQLDTAKLARNENPLRQISMNRSYYAPCVFGDQIVALELQPISGSNLVLQQHLVLINPQLLNKQELVYTEMNFYRPGLFEAEELTGFLGPKDLEIAVEQGLLAKFTLNDLPRTVSLAAPRVTRRFLSWRSNVQDRHVVFDFNVYGLVELPLFFESDAAQASGFTSRALPSLDADYLLFEAFDGGERYILRLE